MIDDSWRNLISVLLSFSASFLEHTKYFRKQFLILQDPKAENQNTLFYTEFKIGRGYILNLKYTSKPLWLLWKLIIARKFRGSFLGDFIFRVVNNNKILQNIFWVIHSFKKCCFPVFIIIENLFKVNFHPLRICHNSAT